MIIARYLGSLFVASGIVLASCWTIQAASAAEPFMLTSSTFKDGTPLAKKNAGDRKDNPNCVGENVSPPLSWSNPPAGTKSHDGRPGRQRWDGCGSLGRLRHSSLGDRLRGGRGQQVIAQLRRWQGDERSGDLFGPVHASGSAAPLHIHADRHRFGTGRSTAWSNAGGALCEVDRPHQGCHGAGRSVRKSVSWHGGIAELRMTNAADRVC